jgi:tetratricopeptide (TPR) repeat protein
MLEFCKKQKPYQEYKNGNNAFEAYDLDQAARWYESAFLTSDPNLSFEIVEKQKEIATIFLDSAFNYLGTIGFNKSEKLIRKARALNPQIEQKADEYLSKIYLLKGDIFYDVKNYEVALENYNKAYKYNSKIRAKFIAKVRLVTNAILDEANKAKDSGDILFALSSLKRLIELRPDLEEEFSFGIESLEVKIQEISEQKMQNEIEDFIESEKNKAKDRVYNQVEIGMNKEQVLQLMGEPSFIEDKYHGNEISELWFYLDAIDEKYVQFYFESNILKRINK